MRNDEFNPQKVNKELDDGGPINDQRLRLNKMVDDQGGRGNLTKDHQIRDKGSNVSSNFILEKVVGSVWP